MGERILFICGTLAPGRDGVGDYTRALATELAHVGLEIALVATHDRVAKRVERSQEQDSGISTVRIPYHTTSPQRTGMLQQLVDDFQPHLISLQYVPYSYNNYGLPLSFALDLSRLRYTGRWHVMYHELWIGHRGLLSPKDTLIYWLQQRVIRVLNRNLRPAVSHTHVPEYRDKLAGTGVSARPLPLFANIAPVGPAQMKDGTAPFRLGFFSQMKMKPGVIDFITELKSWLQTESRKLEIRLIGGGKERVEQTMIALNTHFPATSVTATGFLDAEAVSSELSALDLGLSPVQYHTIGKSGTVAAFLRHGIPVAAPWVTQDRASFFTPELMAGVISRFDAEQLHKATRAAAALDTSAITVTGVATRFLTDLDLPVAAASPRPQ